MPSVAELLSGEHAVKPEAFGVTVPFRSTSIEDQGNALPMGRLVGSVSRGFEFKPPTNQVSQALGAIKARPTLKNRPGRVVATCLAEALAGLGDRSYGGEKSLAEGERVNDVSSLCFEDVAYLVFCRAVERRALRSPIPAAEVVDCPRCHKPIHELQFDLAGTKFPVWDWTPDRPVRAVVHLSRPLRVGSQTTSKLVLGPPAWGRVMNDLAEVDVENESEIDTRLATAAIVAGEDGVEGGFWAGLLPQHLGDLPDWDMDLVKAASRHVGGDITPIARVICPSCEGGIGTPLGWRQVPFC